MARSSFQKLKILRIMDYLLKHSDEEHPVTVAQLIAELERSGITAERKSIYAVIEALRDYGLDIIQSGGGKSSGNLFLHGKNSFSGKQLTVRRLRAQSGADGR